MAAKKTKKPAKKVSRKRNPVVPENEPDDLLDDDADLEFADGLDDEKDSLRYDLDLAMELLTEARDLLDGLHKRLEG